LRFAKRIRLFVTSEWHVDFLPQNINLPHLRLSYKLDDYIRTKEQSVKQFSKREGVAIDYKYKRQDASFERLTKIMEVLGVNIDRASLGKTYERVSVLF